MHMIGHTSNVEFVREHILMRSLNAQDRLQSLYGDCIKLANENKITQKVCLYTAYTRCLMLIYTFVCMYMYCNTLQQIDAFVHGIHALSYVDLYLSMYVHVLQHTATNWCICTRHTRVVLC